MLPPPLLTLRSFAPFTTDASVSTATLEFCKPGLTGTIDTAPKQGASFTITAAVCKTLSVIVVDL